MRDPYAAGLAALLGAGDALAQAGNMMGAGAPGFGWMGGHGGIWATVLLVVVVAALVAWMVKRRGK